MTHFLGIVLLGVVYDLLVTSGERWWRFVFTTLLAIVIAGLMMLSYWDWQP